MTQLDPIQVEMLEDARDGLEVQTKQWACDILAKIVAAGARNITATQFITEATELAQWMANSPFRIKIPALDEAAQWKEQRIANGATH